jgi:hypothetical protein
VFPRDECFSLSAFSDGEHANVPRFGFIDFLHTAAAPAVGDLTQEQFSSADVSEIAGLMVTRWREVQRVALMGAYGCTAMDLRATRCLVQALREQVAFMSEEAAVAVVGHMLQSLPALPMGTRAEGMAYLQGYADAVLAGGDHGRR